MTDKEKFLAGVKFKIRNEWHTLYYVAIGGNSGGVAEFEGDFYAVCEDMTDQGFEYLFYMFGKKHSGTCLFSDLKFIES